MRQIGIALQVAFWACAPVMRLAIDFDRQPRRKADEVDRVRLHRHLLTELVTAGALAQFSPEENFGQAHVLAQGARFADLPEWLPEDVRAPSTASLRLAVPLPVPGRFFGHSSSSSGNGVIGMGAGSPSMRSLRRISPRLQRGISVGWGGLRNASNRALAVSANFAGRFT